MKIQVEMSKRDAENLLHWVDQSLELCSGYDRTILRKLKKQAKKALKAQP